MKKLKCIVIILVCIGCNSFYSFSQSVVTFNRTYDKLFLPNSTFGQVENDSGYLVSAHTSSGGYWSLWIVQINFNGDTLWSKLYGTQWIDGYLGSGIFRNVFNKDYFIGGHYWDNINELQSGCVMRINEQGDTLWTSKFRIADHQNIMAESVFSSDGYIALGGENYDTNATGQNLLPDFCFMKADTSGNFVASKKYPNPGDELFGLTMVETPDHGYMMVGSSNSTNLTNGGYDFYVIRVDSMGNAVWQQCYGGVNDEFGEGITALSDGNFLIMGTRIKGRMYKIDINGSVIWQRNYNTSMPGIYELIISAAELPNGDIVTAGFSTNTPNGYEGGWVMRLNSNGYKIWERYFKWDTINPGQIDNLYNLIQTSDGGLLFSGTSKRSPTLTADSWLLKLDENGCDSAGCATVFTGIEENDYENTNEAIVYPNPFKGNSITLMFPIAPQDGKIEVTFYNDLGQRVLATTAFAAHPAHVLIYDTKLSELPARMYFVQLKTKRGVYSAKVLKQ